MGETNQPERLQPCLTAEVKIIRMQIISLTALASLLVLASSAPQNRPSQTPGSSRATRPLTRRPGELLWAPAPNTLPTGCSIHAGTGAAPGTATTRAPTTGSLAPTQTSTMGSLDSLEVLLRRPWLRMLDLLLTAAEQDEEKLVIA